MSTANLFLNCFPVHLSPHLFTLPFVDYKSWLESTDGLNKNYANYSWYRYENEDHQIRAILFDGPSLPSRLDTTISDVANLPYLGIKIIERAIWGYLVSKGLEASHSEFGTLILRSSPEFTQGMVNIFSGISFKVKRPFADNPYGFVVSAQWQVSISFSQSLAEPTLKKIATGLPVLYKPDGNIDIPKDLRRFRNRYIGVVRETMSDTDAIVHCKDKIPRRVPLSDLYLEASPAVVSQYERQLGPKYSSQSLWYKTQELSFVLNSERRRNTSVLKDRLQAIRKFLGGTKEQLTIPLNCFREGFITINLSPVHVEIS